MTVLSGLRTRERLEAEDPVERLVVSPLLEVSEQLKDDQASIDVRLGFQFASLATNSFGSIDEMSVETSLDRSQYLSSLFETRYVPLGSSLAIHPHQFLLATTLEYIRVLYNLMAYVVGRSTWGRLGFIVATAVGVQPNFAGTLTLELRNLGEAPLQIYPGQTIAQLFFHQIEGAPATDSEGGQYGGSVDILPKTLSSETSLKKLRGLRR